MLRRHSLIALVSAATAVAGCSDSTAPHRAIAPEAAALVSNGSKTGQCFLQLGLAAVQQDPDAGGNATVTAPSGSVVTRVAIKAGTACWFTPAGASGTFTISVGGAPCYVVSGLGDETASVTRIGNGAVCKDISHIEFVSATRTAPALVQICLVVPGAVPPNAVGASFAFVVAGQQVALTNGACSDAIAVPEGIVTIADQPNPFAIVLSSAVTTPSDRLVGIDVGLQTATAAVAAGSITVVTITNVWLIDPGEDQ